MALLSTEATWQKNLFLRDDFSDCEIVVGTPPSSQRFPCHRAILSSASDVFASMFQCECEENTTGKIVITDVNPSDMLNVLRYIYDGLLYIEEWRKAFGILKVAHKYNMNNLCQECEIFLCKSLTLDNVCEILEFSVIYDLAEIKRQCLMLCSKGFFAIILKKSFLELNPFTMKQIFLMEDLNVENELMVFKSAWEKATLECCKKKRKVTEENILDEMKIFIECIRFEFMTEEEFNLLPKAVHHLPEIQSRIALFAEKDVKVNPANEDLNQSNRETPGEANNNVVSFKLVKKREVQFPLGLKNHLTKFKMSISPSENSSTGSLLLKFSFSSYVYLHDITIICLKDSPSSNVPGKNESPSNQMAFSFGAVLARKVTPTTGLFSFYKPHDLFLNVSSKNKIMEVPCKQIVTSYIYVKKFSVVSDGRRSFIGESKEVFKMKFEARRLLLFEAGIEYVLEVCKTSDSPAKCILTFPAVLPKCIPPWKAQLNLHSKEYYGLSKLTVIKAS